MGVRFSEAVARQLAQRLGVVAMPPPAPKRARPARNAAEATARNMPVKAPQKDGAPPRGGRAFPTPPTRQKPAQRVTGALPEKPAKKQVDFADLFHELLATYAKDLLPVTSEFKFAAKLPDEWKRLFRFDAAWPTDPENPWAGGVAVEIDGGSMAFGGGRHSTDEDRVKLNLANVLGWRILRFSPGQLKRDPISCFEVIRCARAWRAGLDSTTAPALPSGWHVDARKREQAAQKAQQESRELRKQTRAAQGLKPPKAPAKRRKVMR